MLLTPSPSSRRPNSSRFERCDQVMRWGQHMFPKPFLSSCHQSFQEIYSTSPSCNLCSDKSQMSSNSFVIERMTSFSGVSNMGCYSNPILNLPYLIHTVFFSNNPHSRPWFWMRKDFLFDTKRQINHQKEVPCFFVRCIRSLFLVLYVTSGISWTHECWLSYHVFLGQGTMAEEWQ